jgi:protein-glutamine gamma-glutamyltransferase
MRTTWQGLSQPFTREQRDTGFLIGVVALTVAPHLLRLPPWASGLTLALLAWRGWLAWRGAPLPSRWVLLLLMVGTAAGAKLTHGVVIGREAGLTLVCVLMALKLLEMHGRRDAFVVFFLGFFLVLTQFLHSQSLTIALWTLITVWGLLTALVLSQMPLGQPSLRTAAREAARTTAFGLPAMVLLFLLFPRIGPLWGQGGASATTGLSDEMSFGQVALLATDDRIALRIRAIEGSLPPPRDFYIRGPVLTAFDGMNWTPRPTATVLPDALVLTGSVLRYELLAEPQRMQQLPVLEHSPGQPSETWAVSEALTLRRNADLVWMAPRAITEPLRLLTVAVPSSNAVMGPLTEHPSLNLARQIPRALNPRTQAWARELQARTADTPAFVQAVMAHIRREPYSYTLSPGVYGEFSPHAIDEFWLDRREGFCEHYASAFVVVLRSAGIPARVVTGYQGHDPLPQGGWLVVRNANAHAWAEYWVEGQGWLRADPTAAVAPERIESGSPLQTPAGVFRGAVEALNPNLWISLRELGENIDLQWRQYVLGYQRDQQFDLLKRLGVQQPNWDTLGYTAAYVIGGLALLGLLWQRWREHRRSPWQRHRARVQTRLKAKGIGALAHQSPLRWADAAMRQHGAAAEGVAQVLLELEAWRYGDEAATPSGWAGRWREATRWRDWWRRFNAAVSALPASR